MPVWDLERKFSACQIGNALSRVWEVKGCKLIPAIDVKGLQTQCPITLESFQDPLLLGDGFVYERKAAEAWLQNHNTSPCTNEPLPHVTSLRLQPLCEAMEALLSASAHQVFENDLENSVSEAEHSLSSLADGAKVPMLSEVQRKLRLCIEKASTISRDLEMKLHHAGTVDKRLGDALCKWAVTQIQTALHSSNCKAVLQKLRAEQSGRESGAALCIQAAARKFRAQHSLLDLKSREVLTSKHIIHSTCKKFLAQSNLDRLLRAHRSDVSSKQLWVACHKGHAQLAERFLRLGADKHVCVRSNIRLLPHPNLCGPPSSLPDRYMSTPLMAATSAGHACIVKLLCGSRVHPDHFRDEESNEGDEGVVEHEEHTSPLCIAAHFGHLEIARLLIEARADANIDGSLWGSPLNVAVCDGHLHIVEYLCESLAQVNLDDTVSEYLQPLVTAASFDRVGILCCLLDWRANVDILEDKVKTPLCGAAGTGQVGNIRVLCEAKADVNKGAPLHWATDAGEAHAVRMLCFQRADVNILSGIFMDAVEFPATAKGRAKKKKKHVKSIRFKEVTPLTFAASTPYYSESINHDVEFMKSRVDVMKVLIFAKADVQGAYDLTDAYRQKLHGQQVEWRWKVNGWQALVLGELSRCILMLADSSEEIVFHTLFKAMRRIDMGSLAWQAAYEHANNARDTSLLGRLLAKPSRARGAKTHST